LVRLGLLEIKKSDGRIDMPDLYRVGFGLGRKGGVKPKSWRAENPAMTLRRFSSRTHRLDTSFLLQHLQGARSYRRIAGYFTSSLFEVANELLEAIPGVKIVCNVDIHPDDLKVAQLRAAKMVGRWNENAVEAEALVNRDRYRRLDAFLARHGQAVRVAPDSVCGFLHGKAGVIELADGRKLGFIGSMNETRSGWQRHYEILWEDESADGVAWIEQEFDFLWNAAKPLPDAVIREVRRRGYRREVLFDAIDDAENLAPAVLIESPLYREGLTLQPWQRGFITECLRHYRQFGRVRLLLADEVGLGKTLSLGTAALALCLLADRESRARKPILILAPATLCRQWQTEMIDKLGIACARWDTQAKVWLSPEERVISPTGREQVARCPLRIGIVSTGLMLRDSLEKQHLLGLRFGLVILDEAHKARTRQGFGPDAGDPNELLAFMRDIAERADHVLLGTATPIQTRPEDLWDLMGILHRGQGSFVLGHEYADWHRPVEVLPLLSGETRVNRSRLCLGIVAFTLAACGGQFGAECPQAVQRHSTGFGGRPTRVADNAPLHRAERGYPRDTGGGIGPRYRWRELFSAGEPAGAPCGSASSGPARGSGAFGAGGG
jgi:hypothetical protein